MTNEARSALVAETVEKYAKFVDDSDRRAVVRVACEAVAEDIIDALLASAPSAPPSEGQIITAILADYPDELDKAACDHCEQCSPIVMCSFHSVLSMLQGHTTPTSLLAPAEPQEDDKPIPWGIDPDEEEIAGVNYRLRRSEVDASPAKETRGALPIRIGGPDALGWPMDESEDDASPKEPR
jgi:hypothetical protein